MGEENFSEKSVVAGQKIFIIKRGKQAKFSKVLWTFFGENRTLNIYSIINK